MQHEFPEPVGSFKAFTNKLIDYAGLFPPAGLSLTQAFHNFLFYKISPYSWMLSNFICPAGKLNELTELMKHIEDDNTAIIPVSILGSGTDDPRKLYEKNDTDLTAINTFHETSSAKASIDAFEIRLPAVLFTDKSGSSILDVLDKINYLIQDSLKKEIPCYFEASITGNFNFCISKLAEAVAIHNMKGYKSGLKLRTGGTEASSFPSVDEAAHTIYTCLEQAIPMKCTAGLHHPIRHYNETVSAKMHGFLNIFGAGILAYTHKLELSKIKEILEDEYSYNFDFTPDSFKCNTITANEENIREAREKFMISFGSCSFDEPIDDLKTIELL
jgi:hypothetical protein